MTIINGADVPTSNSLAQIISDYASYGGTAAATLALQYLFQWATGRRKAAAEARNLEAQATKVEAEAGAVIDQVINARVAALMDRYERNLSQLEQRNEALGKQITALWVYIGVLREKMNAAGIAVPKPPDSLMPVAETTPSK